MGGKRDGFTEYVAARRPQLYRTAYFLCGDAHHAEDLVQGVLTKLSGQVVDVDIAEERIARLLANRELTIPGSPESKPPPWPSTKSAQILRDLLRDEDGALTDVKLRDPRYAKAMWSGDSVPSAYIQLSLFRTDRDPGPPSCPGECENLVVDGKDVVVGQPKGTRGNGYFVLSPERLGKIVVDDRWQQE